MPSLRKRVSTYFRQLSFHNEPRQKRHNINENAFVTKYLQGLIALREGPAIIYGKIPTDLPNYELGRYETGFNSIVGCYSGPNGGLTTVKRVEKHLSLPDADIDFIDTQDESVQAPVLPKKSPQRLPGQPVDNTTMMIKVAGQEYCVTNKAKRHSKSLSLGSITDFSIEIEKTKIDREFYANNNNDSIECRNYSSLDNNNCYRNQNPQESCEDRVTQTKETHQEKRNVRNVERKPSDREHRERKTSDREHRERRSSRSNGPNAPRPVKSILRNPTTVSNVAADHRRTSNASTERKNGSYGLAKSKSEGNPFHHKKKGKITRLSERPTAAKAQDSFEIPTVLIDDSNLPHEWNRKTDLAYGISDSLYDLNQVTKHKNGDPIADCFGIIARRDSAILAVADGVNWGEKASIAAKSAVHGCLHYLNKTIFHDTKLFENLTIKTDAASCDPNDAETPQVTLISNTREVFVCLLRAFNCAHDLILENKGMLTTLTVAVVLPLQKRIKKSDSRNVYSASKRQDGHTKRHSTDESGDSEQYVCCVCNVGDTLAYVYSQKYGMRELTKGSHDINCNRDMRDALGALGPVDGINPELSNLTLSITTLYKGDIILVASDGLTDNFDPNVCRFSVNSLVAAEPSKPKRNNTPSTSKSHQNNPTSIQQTLQAAKQTTVEESTLKNNNQGQPPVKPPRKSQIRRDEDRKSSSRETSVSSTPSIEQVTETQFDKAENSSTDVAINESSHVAEAGVREEIPTVNNKLKSQTESTEFDNPLIAAFMMENSVEDNSRIDKSVVEKNKCSTLDSRKKDFLVNDNRSSSLRRHHSSQKKHLPPASQNRVSAQPAAQRTDKGEGTSSVGYKFLRSRTTLDISTPPVKRPQIARNEEGMAFVTPPQRYELQLLLMEDVLKNGISGHESPCATSRKLCENLLNFTFSITAAKRRTLEDPELYFDNRNGVLVEVSQIEKKIRRKKGLEKVTSLPGKLDHVSIVGYNVGNFVC